MMLSGVNLHLVEDFDDAAKFMAWLSSSTANRIAIDVESEGLDVATDNVRLVQFGDQNDGWALPFDRWSGLAHDAVDRIAKGGGRFVGHNSRFDVAMLRKHGLQVPIHLVDDTRFLAAVANPTVSLGLKNQSAKNIDPRAAAMQSGLDALFHSAGFTWATVPIAATGPCAQYWTYAALDVVLTSRLWDFHAPSVLQEAPRSYDLELAAGWVADKMEQSGVLCDREFTAAQDAEFGALYDSLTERTHSEFGIDPGSKDQIVKVLLADGVKLWKRTPGGDYSLDKEVMDSVDHPLIRIIAERRKVEKLRSTYIRRFLQYSARDGRLHPRINTIGGSSKSVSESGGLFGVRTSRMSLEAPNLQQLPRGGDPLSSVVRNCIVAGEGKTLLMADWDQVELRIMGHLSQDKGLAAAFAAEGDFFTTLTRGIYHDETINKSDRRRQLTKSYVYATLYGAGNDKLATTTGVPLADVEGLSRDFAQAYEGVPTFQREVQNRAMRRAQIENCAPYTRSPLTNRKFIGEAGKEYKLVNFTIQGMAAEILKMKLLELDAAGLGGLLRLPVHDEVILEVDDEDVPEVAHTVQEIMGDNDLLSIPLTAGIASGKKWGEKRDLI